MLTERETKLGTRQLGIYDDLCLNVGSCVSHAIQNQYAFRKAQSHSAA